eukprot:Skav204852  [mRNA]  locus=scaffold1883:147216:148808:+ [translate_table: standard]
MFCARPCRTLAGEGAHMFRAHQKISFLRYLFDGTACPWCLKEYHSHSRLHAHLRYSTVCRQGLQGRGALPVPAPGMGSTADRALLSANDGLVPVVQSQGPVLPIHAGPEWDDHDQDLHERIAGCFLGASSEAALEEAIRAEICRLPISWSTCRKTLLHLGRSLTPQDAEAAEMALHDMVALCAQLGTSTSWTFLRSPTFSSQQSSSSLWSMDLYASESWCADAWQPGWHWRPHIDIPRCFTRHRVLLHAFAGRRRRGDVQWYLDALPAPDGVCILTVSLDIVINSQWGDISQPSVRSYWLHAIEDGMVMGFLCGPPCNTWSRARGVQLADGDHHRAPRVLRHSDSPWGDLCLALRELCQVIDANGLLGFAIEAFLRILLRHGVGILEHPQAPEEDTLVSIWKLPLVQLLLTLPGADMVHLHQGRLGAPTPKPTSLLTANLPDLPRDLSAWHLTEIDPKGGAIGRDSLGGFRTSPLKEYPPAMCQAIALSFWQAFARVPLASGSLDTVFLHRCRSMIVEEFGQYIGPDTAI